MPDFNGGGIFNIDRNAVQETSNFGISSMTPQEKNQDIHDVRSMSDLNSHMDLTSTTSSSTSSMNESQYATPPESSAIVPDPSLLVKNNVQWPSTTNTVEAAMSLLGNHQHHEFNQLFNYVNHIDQVPTI